MLFCSQKYIYRYDILKLFTITNFQNRLEGSKFWYGYMPILYVRYNCCVSVCLLNGKETFCSTELYLILPLSDNWKKTNYRSRTIDYNIILCYRIRFRLYNLIYNKIIDGRDSVPELLTTCANIQSITWRCINSKRNFVYYTF